MSEWKNCIEECPDRDKKVLIYIDNDNVDVNYYVAWHIRPYTAEREDSNYSYFTGKGFGYHIADEHVYWMPLPEPPKLE